MKMLLIATTVLAVGAAAHAQTPRIQRTPGVVKAISDTAITLSQAGGKTETIALSPTWAVIVSKPISVEQITPGSYIGTTNHAKPDGTGVSTEVHVSPAGTKGQGVDFVMDAAADTTMTNGVVSTVASSEGGRVLAVNYGPGVRRVTVPSGVPVVLNTPGERSMVKVGQRIMFNTYRPEAGAPRQYITVGPNGGPAPE